MIDLQGVPIIIDKRLIIGYKQRKIHKNKLINRIFLKLYGEEPIYDTEHIYNIILMVKCICRQQCLIR